jgi:hypothetical protein
MSVDDIIAPGSAVKSLEDIASTRQEATEEERRVFAEVCAEEAADLQKKPGYARTADFVRDSPAALCL